MRAIVIVFYIAITALFATPAAGQSAKTLDTAEVRRWQEDLAVLRKEMPARHANLFHTMTWGQFDSALSSIETRLPALARHQIIVELQKLAAMVGDGHTNLGPWRDSVIAFRTLPISLYWFEEGMIVRAADSAHANLIGRRVLAINGVPFDSVAARIRPVISRDNEMGVRAFTAHY